MNLYIFYVCAIFPLETRHTGSDHTGNGLMEWTLALY
jgi:hypothetical protein